MPKDIPAEVRAYMSRIGQSKSEAKLNAARANSLGTRFKPKRLKEITCSCDGKKLDHKSTCPRGRAIRYRLKKGLPLV